MIFNKKTTSRKRASWKSNGPLWPKVLLVLFLTGLFLGSIGAAFFVIFFSVPPLHAAEQSSVPENQSTLPRVAIIIDDMGYHKRIGESLIELPYDLSFSFLPFAPFSKTLQKTSYLAGKTMLIHLPMQPKGKDISLESHTLFLAESNEKQQQLFEENVAEVPNATGMNNHMGSLFTADPLVMKRILILAQERGYFFVDSVTTADSVGDKIAESLGMPHGKRDIFLDNVAEQAAICGQLHRLVALAEKKGSAIGIAHPYPETLLALQNCLKSAMKNVYLVPVNELMVKKKESI